MASTPKRIAAVFLASVLGLAVLAYAGVLTWFYLHQDDLLYPAKHDDTTPAARGLMDFTGIRIKTPDGETLAAWWAPPPTGGGVVLYLHGQLGSLGTQEYIATRARDMAAAGFGVLVIDYRGYGGSTGRPSEAGLITDARAAYDFIKASAPDAPIAIFGTSLGTGVAVALAAQIKASGLILDSPFSSALHVAEQRYPWLPASLLMRDTWDSAGRIEEAEEPLLLIHCDTDRTVPFAEGAALFARARDPKTMVVLSGCGHIEIWDGAAKDKILETLRGWFTPP